MTKTTIKAITITAKMMPMIKPQFVVGAGVGVDEVVGLTLAVGAAGVVGLVVAVGVTACVGAGVVGTGVAACVGAGVVGVAVGTAGVVATGLV